MGLPMAARGLSSAGLVAVLVPLLGCGDRDRAVGGDFDRGHAREVARDPYALTCRDLSRQSHPRGARLVIAAQTALTREPSLRRRVAELGFQRVNQSIYFALTELCKGRGPSFRPARLAVAGVRSGRYRSDLCLGPGCSDEVRWLAARVRDPRGVVQLVTAHVPGATPAEVRVRTARAEIGLVLRLRIPPRRSGHVRLHCAEVHLGEPVRGRKLVDDGPGRFNRFGVSVDAARERLTRGKIRCVRVPSI